MACVRWAGIGSGSTSKRKPGRKRWIRSNVAAQSCFCRSSRVSGCIGWTNSPVAFMTNTTFLSDSGMASYWCRKPSGQYQPT